MTKPCSCDFKIYRVRKSSDDVKSGAGAFLIYENAAIVANQTKCNVYDDKKRCVWNYQKERK